LFKFIKKKILDFLIFIESGIQKFENFNYYLINLNFLIFKIKRYFHFKIENNLVKFENIQFLERFSSFNLMITLIVKINSSDFKKEIILVFVRFY